MFHTMSSTRIRLDELLVSRALAADLRSAQAAIMTGGVLVADRVVTKPGTRVRIDANVRVRRQANAFASRAGAKLAHALDVFRIDVQNLVVLDAGASAGGFTDCLLQRGARLVYAVDVGFGQMDGRLTNDPRVVVLERTNISDLDASSFERGVPELCTVDLSYLSLRIAVTILAARLPANAPLVCLIKPMYEGLAQDRLTDLDAVEPLLRDLVPALADTKRRVRGLTASPVLGGRGALEFLVHLAPGGTELDLGAAIERALAEAASVVTPS
jgi:23S rRNA (cytidine1920-2'-O)/16S rRNA (cytidine1409-2'-O)-methyltransferase